jgi:hypothetical protein
VQVTSVEGVGPVPARASRPIEYNLRPGKSGFGLEGSFVVIQAQFKAPIDLEIRAQPDNTTCGPTCLHALYAYYGYPMPLRRVIAEIHQLEGGGTVAVSLGNHALRQGFKAQLFTYNLQIFDPTWFSSTGSTPLSAKLRAQARSKSGSKLRRVIQEYLDFLEQGGRVLFENLTRGLIEGFLNSGRPILTGLSATYLYNCAREFGTEYDDIRGEPAGHFVVLCSYDELNREVLVADPLLPNPVSPIQQYRIDIDRVIAAILLGTLTYDANLLIIEPRETL